MTLTRVTNAQLKDVITPERYGAKGDASNNDTTATVAAIDAADIGTILSTTRHTTVYIPAGVYDLDTTLRLAPSTNDNRLIVRGDGDGNTVLRFSNTTGDAVDIVGGYITLEDITIDATAARTAGSGNGIDIQDSLTTTTQFRVELNRVTVQNQPGKGIRGRCPEFLTCVNVSANSNGEQGFYFDDDGHTTFGSWNTFINCRAKGNDLSGFWFDNVSCVYMVNPQALNNTLGGDGQMHFRGGCTNIEVFGADPEAQDVIDASPAVSNVVGIRVQGCRNVRLTGTKSAALDRVISLANNDLVEINGIEHSNNGEASNTEYLVYCDTGNSNVRVSGIRELADYAQTDALIYDAVPGGCIEYLGQEANEPKHGTMSIYKSPVGSFAGGSYDDAWTALELYNNESDTGAAQETGISFNFLNAGNKVPGSIKLVEGGANSTTGHFDIRPPSGGSEAVGIKVHPFGVIEMGGGGRTWRVGTGTPEGAVTAPVGSLFTRTDGGASTTLYVKESGTGNTGWAAK